MTIDISKSIGIRGWMSENELTWLAQMAAAHNLIVEVGCYAGRSTRMLGDYTQGKVYTIDDFQGADGERPLSPEASKNLYLEFKSNLQDLIDDEKVLMLHPDDLTQQDGDMIPDMVFIDGDHTYEGVSKDIKYWGARLEPGGILCGHDSGHPPIGKALAELIPNVKLVPATAIWYTVKE